jgi:hypothetical protein
MFAQGEDDTKSRKRQVGALVFWNVQDYHLEAMILHICLAWIKHQKPEQ